MGKVLRILVILILILSVVSLVFANMLFKKRELLIKRNTMLEDAFIKVSKTIESEDAETSTPPSVEKDISEVSDRELVNPEKQPMLSDYDMSLESPNLVTFDLKSQLKQLRSLYLLDAEGKPVPNEFGTPTMTGKGTMSEILDNVFERAKTQQTKLNKTRDELSKMREKMTLTVEEVNSLKVDGRASKVEITKKTEQVNTLEGEKEELESKVTKLTAEKKELNAELADAQNANEKLAEDKLALQEDVKKLMGLNEELKERLRGKRQVPGVDTEGVVVTQLSAGDKGKILEANDELKFAILEFSNEAMTEMLGPERKNMLPQLEMNVRRPGRDSAAGEFITRIKLRQVVHGKNLVVADILSDWQQTTLEKGDVVFF